MGAFPVRQLAPGHGHLHVAFDLLFNLLGAVHDGLRAVDGGLGRGVLLQHADGLAGPVPLLQVLQAVLAAVLLTILVCLHRLRRLHLLLTARARETRSAAAALLPQGGTAGVLHLSVPLGEVCVVQAAGDNPVPPGGPLPQLPPPVFTMRAESLRLLKTTQSVAGGVCGHISWHGGNSLEVHMKMVHPDKRVKAGVESKVKLKCYFCEERFMSTKARRKHCLLAHIKEMRMLVQLLWDA